MNGQERSAELMHEGQQLALYKRLNPGVDFETWKAERQAKLDQLVAETRGSTERLNEDPE